MKHERLFLNVILCCCLAVGFFMIGCGGGGGGDDHDPEWVIPDELEGRWQTVSKLCAECGTGIPSEHCDITGDDNPTLCAGETWPLTDCPGQLTVTEGEDWINIRCESPMGDDCTHIIDITFTYDQNDITMQGRSEFHGANCVQPGLPTCYDMSASTTKVGPAQPGDC